MQRRFLVRGAKRLAVAGPVTLVAAGAAAWLAVDFSRRIRDWGVMTDELLYVKLATTAALQHSPLPAVHGQSVGVINQLYPLLLAPLYGSLPPPSAFHWAHVLNAPLMASAAVPAYLLARDVVTRRAAVAVAAVSVAVLWMVLTGFLMTEVVAYPAFLWALLAGQRCVAEPSRRHDLLAIAGIALAVLARVQFLLLALVLPLAIVAHELGWALATGERGRRRPAVRDAAAAAYRRHHVLAAAVGVGLAAAGAVALASSLSGALGVYAPAARQGSILPAGLWRSATAHLDSVAIGCGVLPLVLGGGWMLGALRRPPSRREHAFATLAILAICALVLETASFNVRFGGPHVVRDRYVFYIVPLLLVGTAAFLEGAHQAWVASLAVTAFFAATVHWLDFAPVQGLWVDTPTRVLNNVIVDQAGTLAPKTFVAIAGALVGISSVLARRLLRPRLATPLIGAVILAFSVFATQRAIDHTLDSKSVSSRGMSADPGIVLDWVDRVLPPNADAGILPFPTTASVATSAVLWWDVEFWNRSVRQAYQAPNGKFHYTPFPTRVLAPSWRTGLVPGTADATPYLVVAKNDSRFGLAAAWLATNFGLDIVSPQRPYRARWMTRGLQVDGWTRPSRPATIRVFSDAPRPERVELQVELAAPRTSRAAYTLAGRSARLEPGATAAERLGVCVPGRGFADVRLESPTAARAPTLEQSFVTPGVRRIGVQLLRLEAAPNGAPCTVG